MSQVLVFCHGGQIHNVHKKKKNLGEEDIIDQELVQQDAHTAH